MMHYLPGKTKFGNTAGEGRGIVGRDPSANVGKLKRNPVAAEEKGGFQQLPSTFFWEHVADEKEA